MPAPSALASRTNDSLSLTLLGNTLLRQHGERGEEIVVLSSGKPLAMVAFLSCMPANTATREQLLELLWSDTDAEKGRHTLRQTFWYIRRKLDIDPFATTGDGVRLQGLVPSDRDAFLAALDADDPDTAVQHYGGEFFPGFAAPGGAGFEHWADLERTRLRALFLGAATRVVRARLSKGRAREAITIARRAHDLAPRQQAAWRLLLESCLAGDDAIGTAIELERFERWLADEELEPDPATTTLMKAVRAGKASVNGPRADHHDETHGLQAELVGRETQFSELLTAFESAKRGQSHHIHVTAPAGLGKTRLLEGFAARLRSARVRVVAARATPAERSLPYAFAAHLVSALVQLRGASAVSPDTARTLVALAPASSSYLNAEPDRSTGDEALRRRSLAMTELVATISHDAPLVLLVDDVHWMDTQSRTLLAALATRLDALPVLIVTAARHTDHFVNDTPAAHRLALAPLTTDDVGELVMSLAQLPPEPWADAFVCALHATSGGSPLLVMETLQLMIERGQLQLVEQRWQTADSDALIGALGAGRAMQQRLAALPAAARDALLRLAVAGIAVDDAALPHVLTQDGRESLSLLETRGLLTRSNSSWQVAHDEVATLAVEMASETDRARANAAMASYLERTGDDNVSLLVRAASHRARTPDTSALDRTFARAVRSARVNGERTALRTLGREVLGTDSANSDVDRLVSRLPWRTRQRPALIAGSWALAAFALILVIVVVQGSAEPAADVTARLVAISGDERESLSFNVPGGDITGIEAIELQATGDAVPPSVFDSVQVTGRLRSGTYVGSALVGDADGNAIDLVQITSSGDVAPLLTLPHDQAGPNPSPDGRWLLFTSGHWDSTFQRPKLTLLDPVSNEFYRLTKSDARELHPKWSADAARIAFIRSHADDRAAEVCWTLRVERGDHCRELGDGYMATDIVAWSSDHSLLVSARRMPALEPVLLDVDVARGEPRAIDSSATQYFADPTGRLILCLCTLAESGNMVLAAFNPGSPGTKRVLQRDGRAIRAFDASFLLWGKPSPELASVSVIGPVEAFVGQQTRYEVTGRDAVGNERAVLTAKWTSVNPEVATVDSLGVVTMKSPGQARLVVQVGRLRPETLAIGVSRPRDSVAFRERWRSPLAAGWVEFGKPAPTIVHKGDMASLNVNGDGHLSSGIISRSAIGMRSGGGVRAMVRLPIEISQWQALVVSLTPLISDAGLSEWRASDRAEGQFPTSWDAFSAGRACSVRVPRAEGGENLRLVSFVAGGQEVPILKGVPRLTDGHPHSITIQVLSGGRCGLAIDDVVVAVSSNALKTDRPARVVVDGQSIKTAIQVDALEAWSGIRSDIDWNAFQSTAPLASANANRKR